MLKMEPVHSEFYQLEWSIKCLKTVNTKKKLNNLPVIENRIAIVASPTAQMSAFTFCLRVMTAFQIVTFRHHKYHLHTHRYSRTCFVTKEYILINL